MLGFATYFYLLTALIATKEFRISFCLPQACLPLKSC